MSGNDDAWLYPLKAKFAARLASEGDDFRTLHAAGDRAGLIDRAHKLAGIAGMVGFPAVGEAALQLEEAALSEGDYVTQMHGLLAAIAEALA